MLQIPHSILCQRAVTVTHFILALVIDDNRSYMLDLMLSAFRIGLVIAVKQEKWVNDNLLWDLMGLMEEIYSAFVLGIHPQQLQVTSPASASSGTGTGTGVAKAGGWTGPTGAGTGTGGEAGGSTSGSFTVPFSSDAPRQLLLSPLVGVPMELLRDMEGQLLDAKVPSPLPSALLC
jgi:hypothetical protein